MLASSYRYTGNFDKTDQWIDHLPKLYNSRKKVSIFERLEIGDILVWIAEDGLYINGNFTGYL